jgi:hypothetical protein
MMSREYLPLDSPVEAYDWNENNVCINPSIYLQHQGKGRWDDAFVEVAPHRDPATGEVRWYAGHRSHYMNGGGGHLPSCGPWQDGPDNGFSSMQAAARSEIESMLESYEESPACYRDLSPTAVKLLREELALLSGRTAQQLSLF